MQLIFVWFPGRARRAAGTAHLPTVTDWVAVGLVDGGRSGRRALDRTRFAIS